MRRRCAEGEKIMGSRYCYYCGAPFIPENQQQYYCNAECYEADNEYPPPFELGYRRKCLNCGAWYVPKTKKNLYCCSKCRNHYNYKNKSDSKQKPIAKCANCGKEFEIDARHFRYCSADCREAWTRAKSKTYYRERHRTLMGGEFLEEKSPTPITLENGKPIIGERIGTLEEPTPFRVLSKPPKRESTLEQIMKEAAECGLSYGKYRGYLTLGKTYEEIKAKFGKKNR